MTTLRQVGLAGGLGLFVVAHSGGAAWAADGTGAGALGDLAVGLLAVVVGLPALALALVTGVLSVRFGKQATTTKQVFKRSVMGGAAVFLFAVAALAAGAFGGLMVGPRYEFWALFAGAALAALVWIAEAVFSAWQYRRVWRQTKSQSAEVFSVVGLAGIVLLTVICGLFFTSCAYDHTHRSAWTFTWSYEGETERHAMKGPSGCTKRGKAYERKVTVSRNMACNRLCGRRPGPARSACRHGCSKDAELADLQCRTELKRAKM